jgi:hypothetical protein
MAIFEYGEYKNTYDPPDNLVDFSNRVRQSTQTILSLRKRQRRHLSMGHLRQIATLIDHLRAGLGRGRGSGGRYRGNHCQ